MQAYYLRESVLDPVERSLYRALNVVICQRALLLTKINLGDLFWNAYNTTGGELGPLAQQKVDFVVCERDSMRPMGIILFTEDDTLPAQNPQSERIAQLCTQAGLPVVRLQRQQTYLMHQLTPMIEPLLASHTVSDDYSNGDRALEPAKGGQSLCNSNKHKQGRKPHQPAYPGYGALRNMTNKLS